MFALRRMHTSESQRRRSLRSLHWARRSLIFHSVQGHREIAEHLPCTSTYSLDGKRTKIKNDFYFLCDFFKSVRPVNTRDAVKALNILVAGVAGVGKSEFINKVLGMLERKVSHKVLAGGGDQHNTTDFTAVRLEGTQINMLNMWGFDYDNFVDDTMEYILQGKVPSQYRMQRAMSAVERARLDAESAATKHVRRVHSVLMFIGPKDLDRGDALKGKLKAFLQMIQRQGHNPVVVLSQVDMLPQQDWRNSKAAYWTQLKETVSRTLGVSVNSVYLNVNYVKEVSTDYEHDAQTFDIMRDAVSRAVNYEATYGGKGKGVEELREDFGGDFGVN